jgi:hypothetical protein
MFYHFDRTRVAGQSESANFLVRTVYARDSSTRPSIASWRESDHRDRAVNQ